MQENNLARASHFFVDFFAVFAGLSRENAYCVARNFSGSLFLRIGDFFFLREVIFAVRTDWFFSRES